MDPTGEDPTPIQEGPETVPSTEESEKKEKHDEFYKYWDRFMRVKEKKLKSEKMKKDGPVVPTIQSPTVARAGSVSQGAGRIPPLGPPVITPASKRTGPSLDRDVEGRPGHPMVRSNTEGVISSQKATTSYDEAVSSCRAKVDAIKRECRRLNQKYYDRLFNLGPGYMDALATLDSKETPHSMKPIVGIGSVKRVEDIFEEPEFFIDGATASDVKQGINGDCWFLAAVSALSGKPELINRLCVARDEKVGVYGFVFFRDGEWISEVVDDRLALRSSDDAKSNDTQYMLTTDGSQAPWANPLSEQSYRITSLPKEFRESLRKGSNALYFASCKDSNETWLPLLEKAYAKAHGDYQAIEGGFAGEGVEDLTGGIATYIFSEDVLDKDRLWEELLQVNDKFLFGCGSRDGHDSDPMDEEGFVRGHAYTVLAAREIEKPKNMIKLEEQTALKAGRKYTDKKRHEKVRLLKLRNPWGSHEFNGAWSDGSKEWTPEVMKELDHTFGDDGMFWISYSDFLKFYPEIDRIRLIGDEWTVSQQWTAVKVPYTADYIDTSFTLKVDKDGPVVLVLAQPDERYFQGLTGRYQFDLHFRVYKDGEETYIVRSMEHTGSNRSVSAELELEAGSYTILVKISSYRRAEAKTVEEVIKQYREMRRDKLAAVGKSFDAVHSKGKLRELEESGAKEERRDDNLEMRKYNAKLRAHAKKQRGRERARRARRKAEEKRKKEEKEKLAKEKRKAEKEAKKKEEEEKKAKEAAEAKKDESASKGTSTADTTSTMAGHPTPESTPDPDKKAGKAESGAEDDDDEDSEDEDVEEDNDDEAEDADDETEEDEGEDDADDKKEKESNDTKKADSKDKKDATGKGDGKEDAKESTETEDDTATADAKEGADEEMFSCHSSSDDEPVSECSSVADSDFSWDDAIDGSGDGLSDNEGKCESDDESDDDDDDMFKDDPWNARCVIGLRVCSLAKNVVIDVKHGSGDGPVGHEGLEEAA